MIDPLLRNAIIFANMLTLMSIGLTLTYMTTKVPNFAHGTLVTVGIYVSMTAGQIFNLTPYLALPFSFVLGGFTAVVIYLLVLRPQMKRGASIVGLMVATLAIDVFFIGVLNIYADSVQRISKVVTRYFILRRFDFTFADQPGIFFVLPSLVVCSVVLLHILLTRTKFGIAMRAVVEDASLAGVLGINVNKVYLVSWFIAGGLASLAGALLPLWLQGSTDTGTRMIVSIFSASILGGLLNIYGAVLGGLLVGLVEVLGTNLLAQIFGVWIIPYRPALPLAIMVVTLLVAPMGLASIRRSELRAVKRRGRSWL
ncbi:MAG: branched-chain amino acid ABC transporter permease [Nitrososphaerales archaeon]